MESLEKNGKKNRHNEFESDEGNISFLSERVFFGSDDEGEHEKKEKNHFKKII